MKKTLIFIGFIFASVCAHSQITSSGRVYLEAGALQSFASPTIYINPSYNPFLQQVSCRLSITAPSTTIVVSEITVVFDKATVDAKTGTGTGDTAKFFSACNQAVKDWLEAIADNSTVTFTIL